MGIFYAIIHAAIVGSAIWAAYQRGKFVGQCQRDRIHAPASWLTPRHTQESLIREAKRNRRYLREHIDEETLRIIETRFRTNLPAYQRKADGSFDPIAAAHRDGAREVTIYLRQQLELAEIENDD